MKTINLYKSATAVLLGLTTFAITSCNEDDGNGGTPASVYDVIGEYSDAVMAVNGNNFIRLVQAGDEHLVPHFLGGVALEIFLVAGITDIHCGRPPVTLA